MKKKLLLSALTLSAITPTLTFAHGALSYPESRQMYCMNSTSWDGGNDPVCKAIAAAGAQAVWTDWSGVAQGDANARFKNPQTANILESHAAAASSSGVCSGANSKYSILDDASIDWQAHATKINIQDQKDMKYSVTAPHKTAYDLGFGKGYLALYITDNSWKPGQEVTKANLVHLCTYEPSADGNSPMQTGIDGKVESFKCEIPNTVSNGPHVIYSIWQRSDSAEAFYSCSDIDIINSQPVEINWNKYLEMPMYVLNIGDKVLFSANIDGKSVSKSIEITEENKNDWQYDLAEKINSSSDIVQAGKLNSKNKIEPQHNNENIIYINSQESAKVSDITFKHEEGQQPEPEHYDFAPIAAMNKSSNVIYDIPSLKVGDKLVFRLFNNKTNLLTNIKSGNTDIDKIALKITDKNIGKWQFALAKKFNDKSTVKDKVVIGYLNDDEVSPSNSKNANAVYAIKSALDNGDNYSWTIDIRSSEDPQPEPEPTPSDNYTYPEGIGSYELGTIVISDNKEFKCKVPSWCNNEAYKPLGIYSSAAWEDMSEQPEPGPTPEGTWDKNKVYTEQDKPVTLDGITYKANYWTQGDDPRKNNCQYGCPWTKV
ncbi:lytic polysaccharide monooxygenase [Francisella philomiragia]|uniref:lytic polysaccharide monooxygenase n=1 Tax=Francisella philomiragia TaxID=28110 RepID=UPI001903883D|nr:lytic polysaccharide monooxygenase [Francisella philomiragia]MBK2267675.1 lytic polysaccharide monooxygenase [Francisella philomiragia]MBK2279226.1 lytic polysaccharide monooxygenase [Francisella philomiragia]MBK2286985.1 lytic polysaccharide monooxygenase [Francisella philomiragia]MBK2289058.1 lytic polysaccharide monooxygenase [Francisella philomiragia]MBK2290776.1 lytic polysaccharide monooxygenase [Francisella philomiragia]